MSPPSSRVKWLTKKEQGRLSNLLGVPERNREADEDGDPPTPWKAGLAGDDHPFDLAFWLTLLRADAFGSAQASVVAGLQKHATATAAIAEAMEPIDDGAYTACAAGYLAVAKQLRIECLAALVVLMEQGALETIFLLRYFRGMEAIADIVGPLEGASPGFEREEISEQLGNTIASALRTAIAVPGGGTRQLLLTARAAASGVNRIGFRRKDRADAAMLAGLRSGAGGR